MSNLQCIGHHEAPDLAVQVSSGWWQQSVQANEDAMLWARGLVESPSFIPVDGPESCQVSGMFAHGWPVRIGPSHRLAIGVHATCKDGHL